MQTRAPVAFTTQVDLIHFVLASVASWLIIQTARFVSTWRWQSRYHRHKHGWKVQGASERTATWHFAGISLTNMHLSVSHQITYKTAIPAFTRWAVAFGTAMRGWIRCPSWVKISTSCTSDVVDTDNRSLYIFHPIPSQPRVTAPPPFTHWGLLPYFSFLSISPLNLASLSAQRKITKKSQKLEGTKYTMFHNL